MTRKHPRCPDGAPLELQGLRGCSSEVPPCLPAAMRIFMCFLVIHLWRNVFADSVLLFKLVYLPFFITELSEFIILSYLYSGTHEVSYQIYDL